MENDVVNRAIDTPEKRSRLEKRFWGKVNVGDPDECWTWKEGVNFHGYGRMSAGRGNVLKAHRVAFALTFGKLPDGKLVCHTCDNPPCCNPSHLFTGTHGDNTDDMMRKGRGTPPPARFGEKHHNTKFDAATAIAIKEDKRSAEKVAKDHGISAMTVYRLRKGKTWKQL